MAHHCCGKQNFIFKKLNKTKIKEYYESEKNFDSSFHHIFESENFRFPFSYEK